jgi:hypothetical protein
LKKEKVTVLPHTRILKTLPHVISFCFRNWHLRCWAAIQVPTDTLPFISTLLLLSNYFTSNISNQDNNYIINYFALYKCLIEIFFSFTNSQK